MAGRYDLKIKQGDSWATKVMQWLIAGEAVNLSTYTGLCQIRSTSSSGVVATLTVVISNAATGEFYLSMTAAQTAAIPANADAPTDTVSYVYDLQFSVGGVVATVLEGIAYVQPEVSR